MINQYMGVEPSTFQVVKVLKTSEQNGQVTFGKTHRKGENCAGIWWELAETWSFLIQCVLKRSSEFRWILHCLPVSSLKFQPVFSIPLESHVLYSQIIFLEYTKEPTRCLILCAYMICKKYIYVQFFPTIQLIYSYDQHQNGPVGLLTKKTSKDVQSFQVKLPPFHYKMVLDKSPKAFWAIEASANWSCQSHVIHIP